MYLLSLMKEERWIEASLGGKVTYDEMRVFGIELRDLIIQSEIGRYAIHIDMSRAQPFDRNVDRVLTEIKDQCLRQGVTRIMTLVANEAQAEFYTAQRLQNVLEGKESYLLDSAALVGVVNAA